MTHLLKYVLCVLASDSEKKIVIVTLKLSEQKMLKGLQTIFISRYDSVHGLKRYKISFAKDKYDYIAPHKEGKCSQLFNHNLKGYEGPSLLLLSLFKQFFFFFPSLSGSFVHAPMSTSLPSPALSFFWVEFL